jgi:hypothetical protein
MECVQSPTQFQYELNKLFVELFTQLPFIPSYPIEQNEPFDITAVTLTGRVLIIQIRASDTVLRIKQEIYKQDGLMIDQQRMVFNGKRLEDNVCLHSYGIQANSRIHLILRLRGGMFHASSSRSDYLSLSYNSKELLEKGSSMLKYMQNKYDMDILDKIHEKWMECKEEEIPSILNVIEKYYVN